MTWRWFRFVWTGHGGAMAWLLTGSALVAALYGGFAWSWKLVIDAAKGGDIAWAGLLCFGLGGMQAALYVTVQGTRTRVNERIQQAARRRVLTHLTEVAPGTLASWRTGDLLTRLTDDVSTEKLAWFLCSGVFRAYEASMIIVACVVGMACIDPVLTAWAVIPLPLLVISQVFAGQRLARRASQVQEQVSRVGGVIQDVFDGVRVVQARGLQALARRAFTEAARDQADAEVGKARLGHFLNIEFGYGWQLALAVLVYAGGRRVMDGSLGAGDFVAFNGFVMTLVFPMFDLGAFLVRWREAAASLGRLDAVLDLPLGERTWSVPTLELPARITTEHLTLELGESLKLVPGALVAVTGPVGSGKSTLLSALAGQAAIRGPRPMLPTPAWVPQDPIILSVTVGENITLGGGANVDLGLLERACLSEDLARFPAGLATPVGERGVTLSGGQQQRVQIARALATGLPVLLLDDATSALDADTEARFWEGLERDRTVIVVTHRAATLARADVVLYLRAGKVEARGTHAGLVKEHAAYRAAYGGVSEEGNIGRG